VTFAAPVVKLTSKFDALDEAVLCMSGAKRKPFNHLTHQTEMKHSNRHGIAMSFLVIQSNDGRLGYRKRSITRQRACHCHQSASWQQEGVTMLVSLMRDSYSSGVTDPKNGPRSQMLIQ
jgi:hypothetical protein